MKKIICISMVLLVVSIGLLNAEKAFAVEKPKDYPKRPIEVVVGAGPGSGADMTARNFSKYVEKTLGVPFKFSFMPGAAEGIATAYAMDQPADGYTLLLLSTDIVINMALGKVKYNVDDFIWLAKGIHEISALHTRVGNKEFQSFKDILGYCKKNPQARLTVAGSDAMGLDHLWIELLNKGGNLCLKFVPFSKSGERRASFQGGHTTFQSDELIDMEGLHKAGISLPILIGFTERIKKYPDVPCTKEFGIENYLGRWRGFVLKAGTPEPIVKYLEWAFKESFFTKEYQDLLIKDVGHDRPAYAGTEEFKKFVSGEKDVFTKLLKELEYIK